MMETKKNKHIIKADGILLGAIAEYPAGYEIRKVGLSSIMPVMVKHPSFDDAEKHLKECAKEYARRILFSVA